MPQLPWIKVSQNKTQRAGLNAAYGAPLKRIYPPGVFFASNSSGAPGQPNLSRVFPTGQQQAQDPRNQNSSYFRFGVNRSVANAITAGQPTNVGGNAITINQGTSGNSNWLLYGALALIGWVVFQEL
jgi:hypothetical protein